MSRDGGRGFRYRVAQLLGWVMVLGVFALLAASFWSSDEDCTPDSINNMGQKSFAAPPCVTIDQGPLYEARLETSEGTILVLLEPRIAKAAVNNFRFLANNGVYDGTEFHRIVNAADHAYIQGGDPTGTGKGTAGYFYQGELPSPLTRYSRGVIAMVDYRPEEELSDQGSPPLNGSQFFIVADDWEAIGSPNEFPRFTIFGRVFEPESLDVLDRIVALGNAEGEAAEEVLLLRATVREIPRFEPEPSPIPSLT
ncbi:MAG: peptidylprolyl isomerase [Actinomycetota bacterium]